MRSLNRQFRISSLSTTFVCNFLLLLTPVNAATATSTGTIEYPVRTRIITAPPQAGYETRVWKDGGLGLARLQYQLEPGQQAQQVLLHDFESACSPADLYLFNLTISDNSQRRSQPQPQLYSTSRPLLPPGQPQSPELLPPPPPPPSPTLPTPPPSPLLTQHHLHLQKRATGCGTQYNSCDGIGFPQLCCTTTAQCSIDYAGQPACCPIGAVCTGSAATTGTYTTSAAGVYTTTTTTSQADTTSTSVATGTGNGFIQAAGTTVVIISESHGGSRGRGADGGIVRLLGWVGRGVRAVVVG